MRNGCIALCLCAGKEVCTTMPDIVDLDRENGLGADSSNYYSASNGITAPFSYFTTTTLPVMVLLPHFLILLLSKGDLWVQSPVIIIGNIRSIAKNRRRSTEAYRRVMSTWPSMMVGTAEGDLPKLFSPALLA